jgi:hypothetical protein
MQIALLCGSQEAGSNLMVKALYQMEREIEIVMRAQLKNMLPLKKFSGNQINPQKCKP